MSHSDISSPVGPAANFDPVAKPYRAIERLVYGSMLEEARYCFLERWVGARRILLLGDGDGRCLERVLKIAPEATVVSVDASATMLRLAEARLNAGERGKVSFVCADARTYAFEEGGFDAIGTLFFMDCFEDPDARRLAERFRCALRPGGLLVYADFEVVGHGLAKWWKRGLIGVMYAFFRIFAGLRTRRLPDTIAALESQGLEETERRVWWGGFVRASVFRRPFQAEGRD